ncbi:hypothetical protein [Cytobacillus pseudoceanisediminis]|uniref:hypothetical protein n=1 Tax=Cytobacillus pseudoceanisediminis TaxID=3051614 RepID=UPI0034E1D731
MNKNRYLLCLLLCGLLLYYAAPRMGVFNGGTEGIFAISWLALALFVIAGNLTALLFAPKKRLLRGSGCAKWQKGSGCVPSADKVKLQSVSLIVVS